MATSNDKDRRNDTVRGFADLLAAEGKENFQHTDKRLIKASLVTIALWAFFTGSSLLFAPPESFTMISGTEYNVCALAFVVLLLANISRFLPCIYRDRVVYKDNTNFLSSGFMVAALTVQGIAMIANGTMAFFPTPVLIDPITSARVHLVRWSEWAPLAFLLTFLSEEIDVPTPVNRRISLMHSIVQGVCVMSGFVFPFVTNPIIWWSLAAVAVGMFSMLFVRIHQKRGRLAVVRADIGNPESELTADRLERFNRVRLSVRSLEECAVIWTLLVVLHFFAAFAPRFVEKGHILDTPALPMIAESFCEVVSKYLHILVVESVFTAFNEKTRSGRLLEQLRRMMTVVWERSSDTICISIEGSNRRTCMVSPTFFKLALGEKGDEYWSTQGGSTEPVALVFETPIKSLESQPARVYCIRLLDEKKFGSVLETIEPLPVPPALQESIASFAELIEKVWSSDTPTPTCVMHDFVRSQVDTTADIEISGKKKGKKSKKRSSVVSRCEATVSRVESGAIVIVLRDISERVKRFEAEKKLAIESTQREKDSQTNRFTRHEVKNGLLSAIGLCDTMKDIEKTKTASKLEDPAAYDVVQEILKSQSAVADQCMRDLEYTLQEVLDTVVSEALSRDVMHEVYAPREEQVDISAVLKGTRSDRDRFPVVSRPDPLPNLMVDPQLLRHIHRNVLSNACKYGQRGSVVSTEVNYDVLRKMVRIHVVNAPGEYHEKLVEMGKAATEAVFLSGHRLHDKLGVSGSQDDREVSYSSGDGAWLIHKCAKMLGGDCDIEFKEERTVFNLAFPAEPYIGSLSGSSCSNTSFVMPASTWGIAIDDSKVQRKLMGHMLGLLGIAKDKCVILGADADEVLGFNIKVKSLIEEHTDSKFLIIVDENLDIKEESTHQRTISGSLCVERLRNELNPADEARILTLVRSANDSSKDLAIYNSRAHGFLLKAPIRKSHAMEMIAPFWNERFSASDKAQSPQQETLVHKSTITSTTDSLSGSDGELTRHLSVMTTSTDYLMQSVDDLDELLLKKDETTPIAWPSVCDKLHILKGDMMTLSSSNNPRVVAVLEAIEALLRAVSPPLDVRGRWKLIRALIVSLL